MNTKSKKKTSRPQPGVAPRLRAGSHMILRIAPVLPSASCAPAWRAALPRPDLTSYPKHAPGRCCSPFRSGATCTCPALAAKKSRPPGNSAATRLSDLAAHAQRDHALPKRRLCHPDTLGSPTCVTASWPTPLCCCIPCYPPAHASSAALRVFVPAMRSDHLAT